MPTTPGSELLKEAVRLACRAPSVHNSQPWRWVAEGGTLRLFLDRRLRGLIDRLNQPQVLIRVGVAPPMEVLPPPTPRHPLDEVLEIV